MNHPYLDPRAWGALDAAARERFAKLVADVTREPKRVRVDFPAAARLVARGPLDPADPEGLLGPTVDDHVRAALLATYSAAVGGSPRRLGEEVTGLYRFGDADEKRAVVRALDRISVGDAGLPLLADALRTNDASLVAAALGPYGAEHLDDDSWRHGVLKCLFIGVPLAAVAELDRRADAELATMIAAYVYQRVAAGRDVAADVWLVLDRFPEAIERSGLPAELGSPDPDRRAAAERAFAARDRSTTPGDE